MRSPRSSAPALRRSVGRRVVVGTTVLAVLLGVRGADRASAGSTVPACAIDDDAARRATALTGSMSAEDLAAQLLMVSVYGSAPDQVDPARAAANRRAFGASTPAAVVRTLRPGGVLLLGAAGPGGATDRLAAANVQGAAQLRALTSALRAAAGPVGLSIAADQEGGRVSRLSAALGGVPSPAAQAHQGIAAVRDAAFSTGAAMAELGVDVDFAPVVDVVAPKSPAQGVIGDRSFGSDPALVADAVGAAVDALQGRGVAAVAKHFPGHGESLVDTHRARAVIPSSLEALERRALVPFRSAVAHGVVGVMIGHLDVPALDPVLPASLSPRTVAYLRGELGFCGVVYTDGLTMAAVRSGRTDREVARLAYLAGIDVLVGPPDARAARAAIVAEASRSSEALASLRSRAARVIAWRLRMDDRRRGSTPASTTSTSTIASSTTTTTSLAMVTTSSSIA